MTGFVFLDKSEGMTSFSASAKVRRIFSAKKSGHTGTLDPMATGVLVIALGGATRFIDLIPDHDKAYEATMLLGVKTDTLDITGQVLSKAEVHCGADEIEKSLGLFRGETAQLPPMYSAIKKDGVRLYDLARQGIEVDREKRNVNIISLELLGEGERKNEYRIKTECSKGTYVRSLISDIGDSLGCGATMTQLRRIKANSVPIEKCFTLSQLEALSEKGELNEALVKAEDFLPFTGVKVSAAQARRFSNGGSLNTDRFGGGKKPGLYCVFSPEDDFLGVGEIGEECLEMTVKKVYVK